MSIKLSEAIRLGSVLRPQCKRDFFVGEGSCALGAAVEAAGLPVNEEDWPVDCDDQLDVLRQCFPILGFRALDPTVSQWQIKQTLDWIIPTLNDDHGWTRERIADWVETIEASHSPVPESVQEAFLGSAVGKEALRGAL